MTEHFRKIAPAGTQPNLNTSIMKCYEQIVPPLKMQNEFVDYLMHVSDVKTLITSDIQKMKNLKSALIAQFLGGAPK